MLISKSYISFTITVSADLILIDYKIKKQIIPYLEQNHQYRRDSDEYQGQNLRICICCTIQNNQDIFD